MLRRLLPLCLLAFTVFGTGCSSQTYGPSYYSQNLFRYGRQGVHAVGRLPGRMMGMFRSDESFWYADEMHGRPSIRIVLGEQMVYLYKGGHLAGGSPISSGSEGYDTRPGQYRVIEKDIDHKSSIYGDYEDMYGNVIMTNIDNRKDRRPPGTRFEGAKMYYFMRIYGGVGMHQGYLPGYPASHGCIRLPGHMAEKFFHQCPHGTPVTVVP